MTRVLVTGASGQLGKCVKKVGDQYPRIDFTFKSRSELDITDKDSIIKTLSNRNYEYCINCAAYSNVEEAEKHPQMAYAVNAYGVQNLAELCNEYNTRLIHISTDYVFDGHKKEGYSVDDHPNPINKCGKSRWEGEKILEEISNDYHIVRTSWLYSEFGNNFYKKIVEKAKSENTIYVTDQQRGCPTKAVNLARFIVEKLILEKHPDSLIHFTDEEPMTWFDFAKRIIAENKLETSVKVTMDDKYVGLAQRPSNSVLLSN